MVDLAAKIKFAERWVVSADGTPFSLAGRDWVRDEMWRPLDGHKLWPIDPSRLCPSCSSQAGSVVDDPAIADATVAEQHSADCSGLRAEPILIVAIDLPRQRGKTFNAAAWALSRIFKDDHESIALLAGSEDQTKRFFAENYARVVALHKRLEGLADIQGTRIRVPKRKSMVEILPTSLSSVGDTRTVVVLDECRIVPASIAVAMIPTLFARGGWQCPAYHVRTHSGVDDPDAPKTCSVCRTTMRPWYGKALLLSSAGLLTDTDGDWFREFIETYTRQPHPNIHVYSDRGAANPKIAKKMISAAADIFGRLETTKDYAQVEVANEPARKGEQVVSPKEVERATDPSLTKMTTCPDPCVCFVDTSDTNEKTSVVIVAQEPGCPSPWERVYVPHVHYWWPGQDGTNVIDPAAVQRYLADLIPLYPGLQRLAVDIRGRPWAISMVGELRQLGARARKVVEGWSKTRDESVSGWELLESRVRGRTIRLPPMVEIADEFRGVIKKRPSGSAPARVVDRDRRRMHMDITEGLAICCYMAAVLRATQPRSGQYAQYIANRATKVAQLGRAPRPMYQKTPDDGSL